MNHLRVFDDIPEQNQQERREELQWDELRREVREEVRREVRFLLHRHHHHCGCERRAAPNPPHLGKPHIVKSHHRSSKMPKVSVPITDPTTRKDGTALDPLKELAFINIFLSADNGQTYDSVGHAAPGQATFEQQLDAPGTYLFKAEAEDLQTPALDSEDSNVVSFTVAAPMLAAPSAPTLGSPTSS